MPAEEGGLASLSSPSCLPAPGLTTWDADFAALTDLQVDLKQGSPDVLYPSPPPFFFGSKGLRLCKTNILFHKLILSFLDSLFEGSLWEMSRARQEAGVCTLSGSLG